MASWPSPSLPTSTSPPRPSSRCCSSPSPCRGARTNRSCGPAGRLSGSSGGRSVARRLKQGGVNGCSCLWRSCSACSRISRPSPSFSPEDWASSWRSTRCTQEPNNMELGRLCSRRRWFCLPPSWLAQSWPLGTCARRITATAQLQSRQHLPRRGLPQTNMKGGKQLRSQRLRRRHLRQIR